MTNLQKYLAVIPSFSILSILILVQVSKYFFWNFSSYICKKNGAVNEIYCKAAYNIHNYFQS
jgi:hypothetical protein